MADIIPFKGTLYNCEKINGLSNVIAPPYDVISPKEQDELYNAHPHNIIRILLGKDFPQDNEKENKYIRASRFLKDWQNNKILKKDTEDAIYIYGQEFSIDGQIKERIGFIALLKLEEFGTNTSTIYPHENTLTSPKEDRMRLIRAIEANLGPIFALFEDETKAIDTMLMQEIKKSKPIIDILDYKGIRNKLWRVSNKKTIREITQLMVDRKLFIADGHHRYEVGRIFSKLKSEHRYKYILTYFTDLYGDGLVILPVHRLVGGITKDFLATLKEWLKKDFIVKDISSRDDIKGFLSPAFSSEKQFIVYMGNKFIGLSIKDNLNLGVSLVHNLIIEPLKRKVELYKGKIIVDFTNDLDYAINEVDKGRYSFSIILNPTDVKEVRDMAFRGVRMPQKSTYFYPKVITGLVINVF